MDRLERVDIEPINILADRLAQAYPAPPAASPDAAAFRRRDPKILSRIAASGAPPPDVGVLERKAAGAWRALERTLLSVLDMGRDDFLRLFIQLRASKSAGTETWYGLVESYGYLCDGAVPGVEWVDAYAWRLPAADPGRADASRETALLMAAVLYFDTLHRNASGAIDDGEAGEILEALDGLVKICE